jgi:hypothetical protein
MLSAGVGTAPPRDKKKFKDAIYDENAVPTTLARRPASRPSSSLALILDTRAYARRLYLCRDRLSSPFCRA